MTIKTICELCLQAVTDAGYNESTILNYQGVIRRFKKFCIEKNVTEYSHDIGKQYANDVISKKTGKFSKNRYHTQGRFIRLIDSYFDTGTFDFSVVKRGKISPENQQHKIIYEDYQKYLRSIYDNDNTIHFYEYGMYCVLDFLDNICVYDLCDLQPYMVIRYIKETKQTRQREVLCELRAIFRYLERTDLTSAIAGIHAPRIHKIIPILTDEECRKLESVIADGMITLRDAAIVIIGLSCGIRAGDLINLQLSDIDWQNETITFKQSKTGNLVCLPLTPTVGNAIAKYIVNERPDVESNFLFLRTLAPFSPLSDHAACHAIVSKVFKSAGIDCQYRFETSQNKR